MCVYYYFNSAPTGLTLSLRVKFKHNLAIQLLDLTWFTKAESI